MDHTCSCASSLDIVDSSTQIMKSIKNLVSLSLAMAPPVCFTAAYQYVTTEECAFTFNNGDLPSFVAPEAGPNSPGDVHLNEGNEIITRGWDPTDGGPKNGLMCLLLLVRSVFPR